MARVWCVIMREIICLINIREPGRLRPRDVTYVGFQPPYYVVIQGGNKMQSEEKYKSVPECTQFNIILNRHWINNDRLSHSFSICWLDKCFVLSHLWTWQMTRANMIQFIMFLEDLVRFALISGSSVRETLWSWRWKKTASPHLIGSHTRSERDTAAMSTFYIPNLSSKINPSTP